MSEIRKDFLIERYSIISERRGARPHDFEKPLPHKKGGKLCFFCPGNENLTPPTIDRLPKSGKWKLRVFRNKFPALAPPAGEHEIVVDTSDHKKELHDLEPEEIVEAFRLYEKRRIELEKRFRYVSIFKNVGKEGGASLEHTHTQILAAPIIPPIPACEMEAAEAYYKKWRRCPWCDEMENIKRSRIARKTKFTMAIAPNAPRLSYESWVLPRRHVGNFLDLDAEEAVDFCRELKWILAKAYSLNGAYNYVLHHAPKGCNPFHFHIEVLPRASRHAGYELGEGAYIMDTSPETAAKFFRS